MTEAHPFNRISFITLNKTRLFTADQVADLIEEYSAAKSGAVLDAKRLFLRKIAVRIQHEFAQDDDEEYYLCAEDFKNVLDELTQELMDEEEELRQQQKEREQR